MIELWFYWSKSQTKISKKWRENFFVVARDFFNFRTKIKIFSDHVFQNRNTRHVKLFSQKRYDIVIANLKLERVSFAGAGDSTSNTLAGFGSSDTIRPKV